MGIPCGGFVDSTSWQNSDNSATLMPKSAKARARSFKLGSVRLAVRKKGEGLRGERARGRGDSREEEMGGEVGRRGWEERKWWEEGGGAGERRKGEGREGWEEERGRGRRGQGEQRGGVGRE